MAENKMKQVAELLGVELGVPFKIKSCSKKLLNYNPYTFRDNGLYDKNNECCCFTLVSLLSGDFEIEQPILTEKEKRYLENVLKPFKERIMYIQKNILFGYEYIKLGVSLPVSSHGNCVCELPCFDKGTMYKGMELYKSYTLEELGLFQD